MPQLVLLKNPLNPREREAHDLVLGARVIDWLQEHYPDGCGGALRFFVNGGERPLDDLDYAARVDDVIALVICPAGLEPLWVSLIVSVVMTAASIGLSFLLAKPQAPAFSQVDQAQPSPVYSIRANQNQTRLGEPVSVAYGKVLHTPDYAAQPYQFYAGNEQYTDCLFCLGMGEYDVSQVLIGSSDVDALGGAVQWRKVAPGEHLQAPGNLGFLSDFYENMITVAEVENLSFNDHAQTAGPFRISKTNVRGRYIFIDQVYPNGVYGFGGGPPPGMTPIVVGFTIEVYRCGLDGSIGALFFTTDISQTLNSGPQPFRQTFSFDMGELGTWAVKLINGNYFNYDQRSTNWNWVGLRMIAEMPTTPIYGNSTLLCVRIQSTRGIASDSSQMIKVRMSRKLPPLGSGALAPTSSPADVVCDIMTNVDYGAQRPLAEVDVARLASLKPWWATPYAYGFNCVYTGRSTVWEALTQCLVPFAASPLPVGGLMSVAQDGLKPARSMLFSEQNIAQDSFKLSYSFDAVGAPDGIEIDYRDPQTFSPLYARVPSSAINPDKVSVFGITDATHATQLATLMWQRRGGNRRAVAFDTELEGMIPLPGDRAGVQHTLPRWGQSGFVVGVADDLTTITLDRQVKWDDVTGPYYMAFRSEDGGVSNVVEVARGPTDDVALLLADPWAGLDAGWALTLTQEITHFTWGDATHVIKDFILTTLSPQGDGKVSVTGVYYDTAVYSGTLAFLANPVP